MSKRGPLSLIGADRNEDWGSPDMPDNYVVPSKDASGSGQRVWFTAQQGHVRDVSSVLHSRNFPYRTPGDVYRHAIHRHLKWLRLQKPFRSVISQVDAALELCREEEYGQGFTDLLVRMTAVVDKHVQDGNPRQAARFILKSIERLKQIPDDQAFWREKYLREVDAKFGDMLKGSMKASLVDMDVEEGEE